MTGVNGILGLFNTSLKNLSKIDLTGIDSALVGEQTSVYHDIYLFADACPFDLLVYEVNLKVSNNAYLLM